MIQEILKQILLQLDKREIFRKELSITSSYFMTGNFYVIKIHGPIYNAEVPP
jgi:hypothetical protein